MKQKTMSTDETLILRDSDKISQHLSKLNLNGYREHHIEQFIFRIHCCQNCLMEKKCKFCKCNPLDKIKEPIACNKKLYPDMMGLLAWNEYKSNHNIVIK